MDGYVRLLRAKIVQRDFAARNITLVEPGPPAPAETVHGRISPRIVLVDYDNADILDNATLDGVEPLPASPASIF